MATFAWPSDAGICTCGWIDICTAPVATGIGMCFCTFRKVRAAVHCGTETENYKNTNATSCNMAHHGGLGGFPGSHGQPAWGPADIQGFVPSLQGWCSLWQSGSRGIECTNLADGMWHHRWSHGPHLWSEKPGTKKNGTPWSNHPQSLDVISEKPYVTVGISEKWKKSSKKNPDTVSKLLSLALPYTS